MLRSRPNNKSLGSHVVSPEEEKERLQWEGFTEKEGLKSGMKERVGDGKLISIAVMELCIRWSVQSRHSRGHF